MYSPYKYNSVEKNKITSKKSGTWFCGYQFDMTYNFESTIFRSTGFDRKNFVTRSNYFVNNGVCFFIL